MQEDSTSSLIITFAAAIVALLLVFAIVPIVILSVIVAAVTPTEPALTQETGPEPTPVIILRDSPPDAGQYAWHEIVSGLDNPLLVTHAGDGSGRLFVAEQTGFVLLIEEGEINPQPFLDVSLLLSDDVFQGGYTERGLLGLAFHPDYESNGLFFVSYTNTQGHNVLARYQVSQFDPNEADPTSRVELLTVEQPFYDHNGGSLTFGPDGYLYMRIGDGGNPELPNYNSQDPTTLLGKLLRIDVNAETYTIPESNPFADHEEYKPEIWAMGLRNPWRFTFDRATGDLYIGDVGQWAWEEINFQPVDSTGGENYGWSVFEGTHPYLEDATLFSEMTPPIFEYPHSEGCSVTGGYVYQGPALPNLHGVYFSGDYCNGVVRATYRDQTETWHTETFMDTNFIISSFGEDEQGELYLVDYKGGIYRLQTAE